MDQSDFSKIFLLFNFITIALLKANSKYNLAIDKDLKDIQFFEIALRKN